MNGCFQLAVVAALASPAFGQLLVEKEQTAAIGRIFEAAPANSTLRCEIAPMSAALNYGFQFQAVYKIQIPLTQFSGTGHTLNTYTRVTPEGRPAVYLTKEVLRNNISI